MAQRKYPAYVYYARWARQQKKLISDKKYWTEELTPIDRAWWKWRYEQTFASEGEYQAAMSTTVTGCDEN